jgi:hypothetical protein
MRCVIGDDGTDDDVFYPSFSFWSRARTDVTSDVGLTTGMNRIMRLDNLASTREVRERTSEKPLLVSGTPQIDDYYDRQ